MAERSSSKFVVHAALAANLLIALTKLGAAWWTGSSAMLSEAVHSFVDTGDQALLLYGIHRAARPPDESHPIGYGRELYFWSFMVALLIFMVGAGVTFVEGVMHILEPEAIVDPAVNFVVLGVSALFEGASWLYALHEFRKSGATGNLLKAARRSKDPPTFMVLFEDSAALIGLLIAFIGTFAAGYFDAPVLDGVASVAISVLLAIIAIMLANETKQLLIGEQASPAIRDCIVETARSIEGVDQANLLFTVHLGPHQIVSALKIEFDDALTTPQIERKVVEIESAVRRATPDVSAVFIRPKDLPADVPAPHGDTTEAARL
jgi:cation diffusion facilitator family transporter